MFTNLQELPGSRGPQDHKETQKILEVYDTTQVVDDIKETNDVSNPQI